MSLHSGDIENILRNELDPAYKRRAKITLDLISSFKTKAKILDIGCGRGFYEHAISRLWPKTRIWGIDTNEQYLDIARKQVKSKNVIFNKNSSSHLLFPNNSFDIVICSEVLEHVEDDLSLAKEITRVLKPNGLAIISVPSANYPFNLDPLNWTLEKVFKTHIPSNIWWAAGIWADHRRLYSSQEIISKLQLASLKVENSWNITHYCWPFSHFFLYGIGKNLVSAGLAKNFDRFNFASKETAIMSLFKKVIYSLDKLNNEKNCPDTVSHINIIVKCYKPGSKISK